MPGPAVTSVAKAGPSPILFSHLEAALLQGDRLLFLWAWHDRPPSAGQPLGGTSVFVNNDLWSIGLDGSTPLKLASKLPYIVSLHHSAHYGLIAYFSNAEVGKVVFHRVEFTSDGPAKAVAKKHADEVKGLKSEASTVESALTFVNKSGQPIRLFWLDYEGKRKLFKEIAPRERFEQKTFTGHAWVVTDKDENAWYVFRPTDKPETIEIEAPTKK